MARLQQPAGRVPAYEEFLASLQAHKALVDAEMRELRRSLRETDGME